MKKKNIYLQVNFIFLIKMFNIKNELYIELDLSWFYYNELIQKQQFFVLLSCSNFHP